MNGETRCAPSGPAAVQACSGGAWTLKETCASVCIGGACVGKCRPTDKRCTDQTPETCTDAGDWAPEPPCPNACTGQGVCGGDCKPGLKRCAGPQSLSPELCDDKGQWIPNGPVCQNICSSGSCGGSCPPGKLRCASKQAQETCSPMGTWEPSKTCEFVCTGDGVCGGICKPGSKRCGGYGVQTCSPEGEAWVDSESCPFGCDVAKNACRQCSLKQGQTCLDDECATGKFDCNEKCVKSNKNGSCGAGAICSGTTRKDADRCENGACRHFQQETCDQGKVCSGGQCKCPAGQQVIEGTCTSCGALNEPCCPGTRVGQACSSGNLVCQSNGNRNECLRCGEVAANCCPGNKCSRGKGLYCSPVGTTTCYLCTDFPDECAMLGGPQ
jgi:hypothetical protein